MSSWSHLNLSHGIKLKKPIQIYIQRCSLKPCSTFSLTNCACQYIFVEERMRSWLSKCYEVLLLSSAVKGSEKLIPLWEERELIVRKRKSTFWKQYTGLCCKGNPKKLASCCFFLNACIWISDKLRGNASNRGKLGEGLVSAQQVCDSSVGARFSEKASFMVWRQGLRCDFVHGTLCRNFQTLARHRCFSTANMMIWLCAHIQYSVSVHELESTCSSSILRYLILCTVGSNRVFSCHWEWQCLPVGLVCLRNQSKLECPSNYDYILWIFQNSLSCLRPSCGCPLLILREISKTAFGWITTEFLLQTINVPRRWIWNTQWTGSMMWL